MERLRRLAAGTTMAGSWRYETASCAARGGFGERTGSFG